jgi:hypothetical protein
MPSARGADACLLYAAAWQLARALPGDGTAAVTDIIIYE